MKPIHVLLIEDDEGHASLIRHLLPQEVRLERASTLLEGLELAATGGSDAVLLDLSLPDSRGVETVETALAAVHDLPIVVLTSLDDAETGLRSIHQGAQDYIVKASMSGEGLLRALRHAIERQQMQEELNRRAVELQRRNDELERFSRTVAHDLRSPLNSIGGFADVLRLQLEGSVDAESIEYLDYIAQSARRMGILIEDLLDYARAGGEVAVEAVDLGPVLERVRRGLRSGIEEAGARLEVDALPTVMGNADLLQRLLQNLVENGIKYRGANAPVIRVRAEREGLRWAILVEDNGIGMEEADMARIFEPFVRLRGSGDPPGSGLGLATCQRIAQDHGGTITVSSFPGLGSAFRFTLAGVPSLDERLLAGTGTGAGGTGASSSGPS